MLRTILVDDKWENLQVLQSDLEKYCKEDVSILEACLSPVKAMQAIRLHKPDLVFLDIQMDGYEIDGFEMLNILGTIDFAIIFVTAFEKYAFRAFGVDAIGYLTKPFSPQDLKKEVNKAKKWTNADKDSLAYLLGKMGYGLPTEKIRFPVVNGFLYKAPKDIMYCIADKNLTKMYIKGGSSVMIKSSMKDIEAVLPPEQFYRVHHSYLVNKVYVERFRNRNGQGGGEVVMANAEALPVAKSRKRTFLLWMNQEK